MALALALQVLVSKQSETLYDRQPRWSRSSCLVLGSEMNTNDSVEGCTACSAARVLESEHGGQTPVHAPSQLYSSRYAMLRDATRSCAQ